MVDEIYCKLCSTKTLLKGIIYYHNQLKRLKFLTYTLLIEFNMKDLFEWIDQIEMKHIAYVAITSVSLFVVGFIGKF